MFDRAHRLFVASSVILAAGCGSETTPLDIATLFPASNEVSDWTENTGAGPTGVETARTTAELTAIINGASGPFETHNFVSFGQEFYSNTTDQLTLWVFELPDAATATELYIFMPGYGGIIPALGDFQDVTVGDAGRTAATGSDEDGYLLARSGKIYLQAEFTSQTAAVADRVAALATAVFNKIP